MPVNYKKYDDQLNQVQQTLNGIQAATKMMNTSGSHIQRSARDFQKEIVAAAQRIVPENQLKNLQISVNEDRIAPE